MIYLLFCLICQREWLSTSDKGHEGTSLCRDFQYWNLKWFTSNRSITLLCKPEQKYFVKSHPQTPSWRMECIYEWRLLCSYGKDHHNNHVTALHWSTDLAAGLLWQKRCLEYSERTMFCWVIDYLFCFISVEQR